MQELGLGEGQQVEPVAMEAMEGEQRPHLAAAVHCQCLLLR